MKSSSADLLNLAFSHIYVEKNILNHNSTQSILHKLDTKNIILTDHYKDIFCRPHQNYMLQKKSQSLIIAEKTGTLLYEGARVCQNFGNEHFYYTSTVMNCLYDCEYCYLQGLYQSAYIVVFVNMNDIFKELENLIRCFPIYLCVSYDTDLLALENLFGHCKKWIEFAHKNKNVKIEIRTKSVNFDTLKGLKVPENVILAWTLSPDYIVKRYELNTPGLKNRINSIKSAIDLGWKVRICFEPVIYDNDWKNIYKELIDTVFNEIPEEKICDISLGVFRISDEYLKKMKKQNSNSIILNYPYKKENGIFHYGREINIDILDYLTQCISIYTGKDKIFIWGAD